MSPLVKKQLVRVFVPVFVAVASVALVSSADAYEQKSLNATTWASYDVMYPNESSIGQGIDTPVGAWLDGVRIHSSRFYFTFDIGQFAGKKVSRARLLLEQISAVDCTVAAPLELWRTGPITEFKSKLIQPTRIEKLATLQSGGASGCPGLLRLNLIPTIQATLGRGETKLTLGLLLPTDKQLDQRYRRKFHFRPVIDSTSNTVPTLSGVRLEAEPGCGTVESPSYTRGGSDFLAKVDDPDPNDDLTAQFALWPVDQPEQRVEFVASDRGSGNVRADYNLTPHNYPHGMMLAYAARGYDDHDYSPWSQPCYVTIDREPPTQPPVVKSNFGNVWPGPGVPGTFTFDAQGDTEIVAFNWGNEGPIRVDAPAPGAPATVTYTPHEAGSDLIWVSSVDRAGNVGPEVRYDFTVRDTAPDIEVHFGGVGQPSRITMTTQATDATGFSYQIDNGPEVRFPASAGTGSAEVTLTGTGAFQITGRTYVGDQMVGVDTVTISDAPIIESTDFYQPGGPGVIGEPGTFTFRPHTTNVLAYHYGFGYQPEWQRVAAGPDGTAILTWTPVVVGYQTLYVTSESTSGAISGAAAYSFQVHDPRPLVSTNDLSSFPRTDGVGLPMSFSFYSYIPGVAEFVYSFDDGPEQTVTPTFTDGTSADIRWTPLTSGDHVLHVRTRFDDGSLSPVNDYAFHIWTGPLVSVQHPPGFEGGMPGDPATFTFEPGLPGVVEYLVTLPNNTEQVVPADADGKASITYTPTSPGHHDVLVVSRGADGTLSEERRFGFSVRDASISVSGFYTNSTPRGGVGIPGIMGLHTWVHASLAEWQYWVNDGPVQTVPPGGFPSTEFNLVPERSGANVLNVRYRLIDGRLSPVTRYPFKVGTAPAVSSDDYPRNWEPSGGVGVPGTFTFSGGTMGIVEFEYRVVPQLGTETEPVIVPAVNGVATTTYTPLIHYIHYMYVRGRLANGTWTGTTEYSFRVRDDRAFHGGHFPV